MAFSSLRNSVPDSSQSDVTILSNPKDYQVYLWSSQPGPNLSLLPTYLWKVLKENSCDFSLSSIITPVIRDASLKDILLNLLGLSKACHSHKQIHILILDSQSALNSTSVLPYATYFADFAASIESFPNQHYFFICNNLIPAWASYLNSARIKYQNDVLEKVLIDLAVNSNTYPKIHLIDIAHPLSDRTPYVHGDSDMFEERGPYENVTFNLNSYGLECLAVEIVTKLMSRVRTIS